MKTQNDIQSSNKVDKILVPTKERISNVWDLHFPLALSPNNVVDIISFETFLEFYKTHSESLGVTNRKFISEPFADKDFYYQSRGDFFGFFKDGELYGVFTGNTIDWSTYYFRSVLIHPDHREHANYQNFLKYLTGILKNLGCNRIEAHIAPFNHPSIHVLNKLGFMITGTLLSDRYGNLIHFSYFLNEHSKNAFINNFCPM